MEQKVNFREQRKNIVFFKKNFKMRIALCDKDENFIKTVKRSIYHYANLNRMDLVVDGYTAGEELIRSEVKYTLIFLNYTLTGINGLETAKKLRFNKNTAEIIFLSRETHFVFEAFKVKPYRFLTKPIKEDILCEALDDFFKSRSANSPLWVKDGENTFCLNACDIMYLEADNKHCFVHLDRETIGCNKTMARVYSALPHSYFYKINRAYIINLNYVQKYNNDLIYLSNGKSLHISRNYLKGFKEYYKSFCNPKIP